MLEKLTILPSLKIGKRKKNKKCESECSESENDADDEDDSNEEHDADRDISEVDFSTDEENSDVDYCNRQVIARARGKRNEKSVKRFCMNDFRIALIGIDTQQLPCGYAG